MDVVLCGLVLYHLGELPSVLAEFARVGRPGALVVVVITRPFAPDPSSLIFRFRRHPPEAIERAMTDGGTRRCPSPQPQRARAPFRDRIHRSSA